MTPVRTARAALAFVRKHGIVLESGRGHVPSLAEAIAGEPIRGSWWSHPEGERIFELTRAVRDAKDVLVCRLVGDKITFVHRRMWPELVRHADQYPKRALARITEVHTESGRHAVRMIRFPDWVPKSISARRA